MADIIKPIKPKRILLTEEEKKERARLRHLRYRATHIDAIKAKAILYRATPHYKAIQQQCMKNWYEKNKTKQIDHVLQMQQVNKQKYNCTFCDYHTCNKTSYDRHLQTKKHKKHLI